MISEKKKSKPPPSGQGHVTSHRRNYRKGGTERKALTQKRPGTQPPTGLYLGKKVLGPRIIICRSSPSKSATPGQRGPESRKRGLLPCVCPRSQQWARGVKNSERDHRHCWTQPGVSGTSSRSALLLQELAGEGAFKPRHRGIRGCVAQVDKSVPQSVSWQC